MAKSKEKIKVYPANVEAEVYLLSCMLNDRTFADEYMVKLSERDFTDKRNLTIFKAMITLQGERIVPDFVTLVDKLRKMGKLGDAGELSYVTDLMEKSYSTEKGVYYFDILKREATLRQLLSIAQEIADDAYCSDDAESSLAKAQSAIINVAKNSDVKELTSVRELTDDVLGIIEERYSNPEGNRGLMTGFPNFDKATNGLQRSDILLLAARPGVGKTAFALNIAANIAKRKEKKKILIFSLEMSDIQLVTRLLCNMSEVNNTDIKTGNLKTDDFVKLRQARDLLRDSGIYIDQTSEVTPEKIRAKCRQFRLQNGEIDLIIVDYLQLMESGKNVESRQQQVADISRQMKLMAKELNVPVILLSQMSRMSEINNEEPELHHLRDSGAIEQDADIVVFLHKPKDQINDPEIIKLKIAKFRNGQQQDLAFSWNGPTFTFTPQSTDMLKKIVVREKNQGNGANNRRRTGDGGEE